MSNTFHCQDPGHEGNPAEIHYLDRLEERVELRRISDLGRERVIKTGDICKPCARKKYPRVPRQAQTVPLFPSRAQA